jgi:hypothetical protein
MEYSYNNDINTFSGKKVSIEQAIKILKRNGIQTDEEQARIILNFLYLLAKAYKSTSCLDDQVDTNDPYIKKVPAH